MAALPVRPARPKTPAGRFLALGWTVGVLAAGGFVVGAAQGRLQRVEQVSALAGRARAADRPDARSATGYADGQRELIVPERNEESFDWIAGTQRMFARGELRVRRADHDNAPYGRDVSAASPYRWWLGLMALADRAATGRPIGLAVEHAALGADPLLQLGALVALAAFAAWALGGPAALVLAVGMAAVFPFAAGFLPGAPDQRGLAGVLGLGSLVALVGGLRAPSSRRCRGLFAAAGVIAGLGVWVSVPTEVPLLAGAFLGAAAAALVFRRAPDAGPAWTPAPWRIWGYTGGATVLAAYVAEYFPDHMGTLRLSAVHPAYGVALVGAGELLGLLLGRPADSLRPRRLLVLGLAAAAVLLVPVLMWRAGNPGFLEKDLLWAQLDRLPGAPVDTGTLAWLGHAGLTGAAVATLLPVLSLVWAAALLGRGEAPVSARAAVLVALGPVAVALALAVTRLGWWSFADAALLASWASLAGPGIRPGFRMSFAAVVAAAAGAGLVQLRPAPGGPALVLTGREAEELVDRHLAHWLAQRAGEAGAIVLAPPHQSADLAFFGGLRGIGSFAPDNRAGFEAELNLAAARSMEQIQQDLQARGVRYLVLPSWDPFFDEFGRRYLDPRYAGRTSFLVDELRQWRVPGWLRPVPYQPPVSGGNGAAAVLVFEVGDEAVPAVAASRLAEYLVETGNLEQAGVVAEGLRRYPGDIGALTARAEVENARGSTVAFGRTVDTLLTRLPNGGDHYLPWDRRVGLAVVLAQSDHVAPAREQLQRCLNEATAARLRSLSTGSLFALLELSRLLHLELPDPGLRALAPQLLPGDLRDRL